MQRLNDLSSTNDSIVPTILFAFTPDFTCVMCIWLLCIVPCDYSSSFKTDVVIIVIPHSQIVSLSIVNRALVILSNMHGASMYLQFVQIFSIVFNSNDLISWGIQKGMGKCNRCYFLPVLLIRLQRLNVLSSTSD